MTTSKPIPFPVNLEALADSELLWELGALELGGLVRILRHGWRQEEPCFLRDSDDLLATVARLTPEQWAPARQRVLLTLQAHCCAGVLKFVRARSEWERLARAAQELSARQRKAGLASAASREGRPTGGQPVVDRWSTGGRPPVESGGATRAAYTPAGGALSRFRDKAKPERQGASEPAGAGPVIGPLDPASIAGAIFDGLEAAARAKLDEYRRSQCEQMIRKACDPWLKAGRILTRQRMVTLPGGKKELRGGGQARTECEREIRTIAAHPNVRPALLEICLTRCAVRDQDPDQDPIDNPIGYVIKALGAYAGGKPLTVYLGDQAIVDKWDAQERRVFDSARTMAAATEAARRVDAKARAMDPDAQPPRQEVRHA